MICTLSSSHWQRVSKLTNPTECSEFNSNEEWRYTQSLPYKAMHFQSLLCIIIDGNYAWPVRVGCSTDLRVPPVPRVPPGRAVPPAPT